MVKQFKDSKFQEYSMRAEKKQLASVDLPCNCERCETKKGIIRLC